jgi:pyruvate formate lyase activating enzyme
LDTQTRLGELFKFLDVDNLLCTACGHLCKLRPGQRSVCKIRFNSDGILLVPWQYVAGLQNDPIEKNLFFHALPGCRALSFEMLGCNFHCAYCQNWFTSQSLRDDASTMNSTSVSAKNICDRANDAKVVSTYNEPVITSEWAVNFFKKRNRESYGPPMFRTDMERPKYLNLSGSGSI